MVHECVAWLPSYYLAYVWFDICQSQLVQPSTWTGCGVNSLPLRIKYIILCKSTIRLFQQPFQPSDDYHLQTKPNICPWRAWTPFFSVWRNFLSHFGPTYQSVRCVKNVSRSFSQVVLSDAWLINFSINCGPCVVKSGMFQSSRTPSWAVIS